MKKYARRIAETDNVLTAVADCKAGDQITVVWKGNEMNYACNQDVPFGHKIAAGDIARGAKVIKYGESIGSASMDIMKGDWVHTHNVKDDYKCLDKNGHPLPGQEH